jgi:ubiquitin C-terminal hydrolase
MDYNPLSFTYAFKEPDNKTPTNTGEQKDAQEFLTFLFDRLERALMPTPRKYLL